MVPWRRSSSSTASHGPARPLAAGVAVGNARVSPDSSAVSSPLAGEEEEEGVDEERWSALVPDLLTDILRRVEAGAKWWPPRRDVVACACVCRRWRNAAVAIVRPPLESGRITFLSSLKQSGPRDAPIRCFIRRNKKNSMFYLYLGLTQELTDMGKFLLVARRFRRGLHMEYIISIGSDGISRGSHSYVGKIKSDFMGTKSVIYDRQPPYEDAKASSSRSARLFASKKISARVSTGNFEVGEVSYEYILCRSGGPRRIHCSVQCPLDEGSAIYPQEEKQLSTLSSLILNNKVARWHEHLHCWCLNFRGRVMVASVKNFQLVAPAGTGEPWGVQDGETVILQFGKIGVDVFTMDYRQPLSAFQAFAICLTSFGTKLACQ